MVNISVWFSLLLSQLVYGVTALVRAPFYFGATLARRKTQLKHFTREIRRILAKNDWSINRFATIVEKHNLIFGTVSTYIYQTNAPSLANLWRLSRALSEVDQTEPEVIFLALARTLDDDRT